MMAALVIVYTAVTQIAPAVPPAHQPITGARATVVAPPFPGATTQTRLTSANGREHVIQMSAQPPYYTPAELYASVGDVVTWSHMHEHSDPHSVMAARGAFQSPPIRAGESWSFLCSRPGRFDYACRFHPWMEGRLIIRWPREPWLRVIVSQGEGEPHGGALEHGGLWCASRVGTGWCLALALSSGVQTTIPLSIELETIERVSVDGRRVFVLGRPGRLYAGEIDGSGWTEVFATPRGADVWALAPTRLWWSTCGESRVFTLPLSSLSDVQPVAHDLGFSVGELQASGKGGAVVASQDGLRAIALDGGTREPVEIGKDRSLCFAMPTDTGWWAVDSRHHVLLSWQNSWRFEYRLPIIDARVVALGMDAGMRPFVLFDRGLLASLTEDGRWSVRELPEQPAMVWWSVQGTAVRLTDGTVALVGSRKKQQHESVPIPGHTP